MRLRYLLPLFWVIALAIFLPALRGEFIMDDWAYITKNPAVVGAVLPFKYWFSLTAVQDYWPLTYTFYWLFFRLFGEEPLAYHLINLALHVGNSLLVFLIARRLTPRWSLVAALLFLVHPLHVQAVAWIIQFKTLLATSAALVSLLFVLADEERKALGAFAVSALAKTSAIFMPGVYWLLGVKGRRLWPFLSLSALSGVTTLLANQWNFYEHEARVLNIAWYERSLMMVQNFLFYVASFVWPHRLAYLYPYQADWSAWKMGLEAIFIAAAAAALWRWRPSKVTQLCLSAYSILLFPALGLVTIPNMKLSLVADHWAYLPDVFLCLLVARALERLPTRAVYALSGAVLVLLSYLSFQHAKTFATEIAFWEQSLLLTPNSAIPYYNLGTVYDRLGDDVSAKNAYETAVKHDPDHSRAWYNLGRVHFRLGQPGYAREEFQRSINLNPKLDLAYVALAKVNLSLQDTAEAEKVLRLGLEKNPDSEELKKVLDKVLNSSDSL